MKKKILIDVSTIFKPILGPRYVSGVGRSTFLLLNAISKLPSLPFEIELFGSGLSSLHLNANGLPYSYHCLPLPQSIRNVHTRLEPFVWRNIYKYDIMHIPHNYDRSLVKDMNFVVTMHDTSEYDSALENGLAWMIESWRLAAKYSKKIITCSNSSKRDILDRFRVNEDKIEVIPWGISKEKFHRINEGVLKLKLKELNVDGPYFLAVSCSTGRKNTVNLLKAFHSFSNVNRDISLVLVWGNPPAYLLKEYSDEIKTGRIRFLNYVSDEDLVALYCGALATMYPSRYEGFGFPILESYACGTPVMTCNNSSLSEIGGDLAVYVGEDNIDEMIQVFNMFADGTYDLEKFEANVPRVLDIYSWDITAKKYVDLYYNVVKETD